ncbi:MAG: asparagine synthase (glutamine-hydrolyzing) [Novosphingobium sp.]|jgi:asparagine synthase (glutamine-hydrolysing)|uniref:asparagine synthase (glutamine-hydrolyzing) n=1 Tax=Novosphingobium sp. TaxID=1874826 RepID=UPI0022C6D5C9|nr:asparagine synthase (glutamine-hydrolyzing) [Novosphingobium sp.]MCZ8036526.1 asparagine synthase (glutamine-hydrolyzing) [Novosphingobium sp.]
MCGITGFLDCRRDQGAHELAAAVKAMADVIQHRGPDDDGVWVDPDIGLALGFRRLAIVDLSPAGHQPMISASGRSVLCYNGEIYNADELRPALIERGVVFRGHSDSEVLLEHAEAFGFEATLRKLVGMFAICWHDRRDRTSWLARDRMGEKPLFIARFGRVLMFASELRALRVHRAFSAEIDPAGLSGYMRFGYVPQPYTIYRSVEPLAPGELMRIADDGEIERHRYWDAAQAAVASRSVPFAGSDTEAVDALEAVLQHAVGGNMLADVPLGAFLSGGIDSSTIVALMQAQSDRPVRTFSIGFQVEGFDEAPHARAVARHLGTEHTELYFTARDFLDRVPRLPDIWDQPFADSSQLPTHMVSAMARAQVTVALSGDGGDELFAGYSRYAQIAMVDAAARSSRGLAAPLGGAVHRLMNAPALRPARSLLPPVFRARLDRWSGRMAETAGPYGLERAYRRLVSQGLPPEDLLVHPSEQPAPLWRGALADAFPDPVERAQMIDTLTYLPDDILTKVDRTSMAVSLETRAPFLDHRVVEFAWSLPERFKRRDGEGKWALRQLLFRHVPRAIVERPKMGFGVPIDVWLRGPLRDWAEALLDERRLAAEGVLRPARVREIWTRHLAGEQWQYPLWTILMFQAWKERWGH